MRDHTKLRAFELADEVVILVYQVTRAFPKEEVYGLTSQMRRAAVSAASNIVEGCARETRSDYLRFLTISFGSLRELHYRSTFRNDWDTSSIHAPPNAWKNWKKLKKFSVR